MPDYLKRLAILGAGLVVALLLDHYAPPLAAQSFHYVILGSWLSWLAHDIFPEGRKCRND